MLVARGTDGGEETRSRGEETPRLKEEGARTEDGGWGMPVSSGLMNGHR